ANQMLSGHGEQTFIIAVRVRHEPHRHVMRLKAARPITIVRRLSSQENMPKEGITPRSQDYAQWYLDIVRDADLADYAEVVRGCIVFKPTGFALWEAIQSGLDQRIK